MGIKNLAVVVGLIAVTVCACAQTKPVDFRPNNLTPADETAVQDRSWTSEAWSGDNAPYQRARNDIDTSLEAGQDMNALRVKYGLLAQKNPKDPLAQFRWAYASADAIKSTTPYQISLSYLFGVAEALARAPSPHAYDYARERFLIEVWFSRTQGLEKLGQRLLEHAPSDFPVQYAYVHVLKWSPVPGANDKALSMAQQLARQYPQKPKPRNLIASIYTERWWKTHNKDDANKALVAFQECLRLTPSDSVHRKDIQEMIAKISKQIDTQN